MPFLATFSCLWCGNPHTTRGPDDLEGWAQLCSTCLGKAGDNGFLRARLKGAIAERGRASGGGAAAGQPAGGSGAARAAERPGAPAPVDAPGSADDEDDWYLRRGRHAQGPIHDAAWNAELDAAGRWLDALPLRGEIVDLAAGTGWWSTLLASKGELSLYDTDPARLERARKRLVAHGLRAHLHARDPWAEPDRRVGAVVIGRWLDGVPPERLPDLWVLVRRWLQPGGRLALIATLGDDAGSAGLTTSELALMLADASFEAIDVSTTGRFLILATAVAPP